MPTVNWDVFLNLPGAQDVNFERLCRTLVRRHYGQFGEFKELSNQAGVEFHLKLERSCDLGAPPRWFGWQCKWYQIPSGQKIGAARRSQILDGLKKTQEHLPDLTDWVLWTRQTLTKDDQTWFYGLKKQFPKLTLELKTAADIEGMLVGDSAVLREIYFGELIITAQTLADQYRIASAPFSKRYEAAVHHVTETEKELLKSLGNTNAWSGLSMRAAELTDIVEQVKATRDAFPDTLAPDITKLFDQSEGYANRLLSLYSALSAGKLEQVRQLLTQQLDAPSLNKRVVSRLRSARAPAAPLSSNLIAALYGGASEIRDLQDLIDLRSVAVLAAAGEGKSELSVRLASPSGGFPGGVLLLGKNLRAGQTLDSLISSFKIGGKPAQSFEHLAEALDAAGQRLGSRLPLVIDGLNEAEDPRNWKDLLSQATEILRPFAYVSLIVTLRNEFADDCLSDDHDRVELDGFEGNLTEAIERYFDFYKIDATDADLPLELLQHPLTLKIFCEVANPRRQLMVGVEALPRSLTNLFSEHLKKVAERVAELSPSSRRIYQQEVQAAISRIAQLLWDDNVRSIEMGRLRDEINDSKDWDSSLVRSLESEGILVRTSDVDGTHGVGFAYDLLAGHVIAQQLSRRPDIDTWLREEANLKLLTSWESRPHTLGFDVFKSLVAWLPKRNPENHLWKLLTGNASLNALLWTTSIDPADIDRETVERFQRAMLESEKFAELAFPRLKVSRAAAGHPYDSLFLTRVLGAMSNLNRDLTWSEWHRMNLDTSIADVQSLDVRWGSGLLSGTEINRVRWVIWMLTTTSRYLRDLCTKALYTYASAAPSAFFAEAIATLSVSDPYVPERCLAAAYGAALSKWSDRSEPAMRQVLIDTVPLLLDASFRPGAPNSSRHALLREYCLGLIGLAQKIDPKCLSPKDAKYLAKPFSHLPTPFGHKAKVSKSEIQKVDRDAISMDFGNYTFGRLIPGRSNYDYANPDYVRTRREIVKRMIELGYDADRFGALKRPINEHSRTNDHRKIDRYGKKYGWIAYFEMWGWRSDKGRLPTWWGQDRSSEVDIDPSFPVQSPVWTPPVNDVFAGAPKDMANWVFSGPTPDYSHLLERDQVDGVEGPWVLLDGYINETAATDYRGVFSFLRGVLVSKSKAKSLLLAFERMRYPGNDAIRPIPDYHYRYAGEMPFHQPPHLGLSGLSPVDDEEDYGNPFRRGVNLPRVDVPVQSYSWESYHSELNQAGGTILPSARLCQASNLSYRQNVFDLHDEQGVGSLHRRLDAHETRLSGRLTYIRADLLRKYLKINKQRLIWLVWGEREQNYRGYRDDDALNYASSNYDHIHKTAAEWTDHVR